LQVEHFPNWLGLKDRGGRQHRDAVSGQCRDRGLEVSATIADV
jgi:hypothetical protein